MKKILFSLATLVAVAGVVAGSTIAFYNDTETSGSNIFTAGSVDLKVDHTRQTYNGVDCQTCSVTLYSDTSDVVTERYTGGVPNDPSTGTLDAAFVPHPAVLVSNPHAAWVPESSLPGAEWIWATDPTTQEDTTNNVVYTFEKTFVWNGGDTSNVGVSLDLGVAADNTYIVYLNGVFVDSDTNPNNFSAVDTVPESAFDGKLQTGTNVLTIKVQNLAAAGGPSGNPGGLLYKLTLDGDCESDYFQAQCRLWNEKDLGENDTFFNFDDVKPGDFGTNVISLHSFDNDAWACLIVHGSDDQENNLLENEVEAGDAPNQGNAEGFGELSDYLNVFTWLDDGDGLYEGSETQLGSGPLSGLGPIASLDADGVFLTGTTTAYVGLAWCAGSLDPQTLECDGEGMENDAQSDSFSASLTAYAEQVRNNADFECAEVDLEPEAEGPFVPPPASTTQP